MALHWAALAAFCSAALHLMHPPCAAFVAPTHLIFRKDPASSPIPQTVFPATRPPTGKRPPNDRPLFLSTASTSADTNQQQPVPDLKVGDTKGASLLLEDVSVSQGSSQILSSIDWRVQRGERWGIVGPNGAGKSTLLGAISGLVRMDSGKALVAPKARVGHLRQTAVSGSRRTVAEEAASEMYEINSARERMDGAAARIEGGDASDAALKELDDATARFGDLGGYTQEQTVGSVLGGLGFRLPEDAERPCSDFSGGWQMRIALARLLLSKPTVLLLDEPSNHLDSSARDWLGKYLAGYDGSIVLVSHDVALLEASVNSIAEISAGTLLTYVSCTYSQYLDEKEFRAKSAAAEYERNLAEAAKLQAYVDRFGASATKASSAQSRVKQLERMRKEGKLDAPPEAVVSTRRRPELVLPDPPKSMGEDLIIVQRADIGHDPDGEALLSNINLVVRRGMKLILRGPNGAGKSTLLAALRGKLPLLGGERIENERLRLGVFTQDLAQELDAGARAVDLVTAHAREGKYGDITVSDQDARSVMGRLGLGGEKPLRKVGELSGGEKARVALSMFALKASNVLMLDEPSNHLDVECIESLGDALSNWGGKDGAVVVVSHDRAFCEQVGFTHVGTVKEGGLVLEERGLDGRDWEQYDMRLSGDAAGSAESSDWAAAPELTAKEKAEQKRKRKAAFNAPKRISKLEQMIEKAEIKIAEYDEEMMDCGNDVGKLMDITEKKQEEESNVAKLMEEWEELEELLIEME